MAGPALPTANLSSFPKNHLATYPWVITCSLKGQCRAQRNRKSESTHDTISGMSAVLHAKACAMSDENGWSVGGVQVEKDEVAVSMWSYSCGKVLMGVWVARAFLPFGDEED